MDVYLVEDSAMLRMRLEALLSRVPNTRIVGIASGAQEAIDGILATQPQIALVDIGLAQGTGFDVLRQVRRRAPQVEIYMLSNFAAEPYRRLAAELGVNDFFDKSSEFEHVRDLVAERAAHYATNAKREPSCLP
jgi:DNA-binding NarL/FixJ family response regulator